MACDDFRQFLLDAQWDPATRRQATEALMHLESCTDCQESLHDFDRLRDVLGSFQTDVTPPDGWRSFERRLLAAKVSSSPWPGRGALALAASVLIVGGLAFGLGRYTTRVGTWAPSMGPNVQAAEGPPHFGPQQIRHDISAFTQVSEVFDGRASWMLMSKEASDVGVSQEPVAMDARNILLLRLTLTRNGKVASDVDLLVIPGQRANLTVPFLQDQSLHYRIGTSTDEPTRLSVWLEVQTPRGGAPLAALSTNLRMQPGEKTTAGQLSTSADDYELKIGFARAALRGDRP